MDPEGLISCWLKSQFRKVQKSLFDHGSKIRYQFTPLRADSNWTFYPAKCVGCSSACWLVHISPCVLHQNLHVSWFQKWVWVKSLVVHCSHRWFFWTFLPWYHSYWPISRSKTRGFSDVILLLEQPKKSGFDLTELGSTSDLPALKG